MQITFYNWSDSPFTYSWDSKLFTFLPGRVYSDFLASDDGSSKIILEKGIAEHFAKHLANREANKKGIDLGLMDIVEEFRIRALSLPEAREPEAPVEKSAEPVAAMAIESAMEAPRGEVIQKRRPRVVKKSEE